MRLLHLFKVAKLILIDLCTDLKDGWQDFRALARWQQINIILCGVGIIILGIITPERKPLPTQRILIPWELMDESSRNFEAAAVCMFLLMIGVMLFFLKRYQRFLYGMLEIVVAVGACWKWYLPQGRTIPVMIEQGTMADVVAAFTIVYIVVRGLDNCAEYRKTRREKTAAAVTFQK